MPTVPSIDSRGSVDKLTKCIPPDFKVARPSIGMGGRCPYEICMLRNNKNAIIEASGLWHACLGLVKTIWKES
jgi:hypothetical protein